MVRRGRNQLNSRGGISKFGNKFIHLVPRQLPPFAGLGPLGHFDLQFLGIHQIMRRHPKAAGRHLLDIRIFGIPVRQRLKSFWVLATLSGIAFGTYAIHRDGQGLMRFFTDCPKRHGTRRKSFHNFASGFHFFKRDRVGRPFKLKQPAKRRASLVLFIHQSRKILIGFGIISTGRMLQFVYGFGIPVMMFSLNPVVNFSAKIQLPYGNRTIGKRMSPQGLLSHLTETDSLDP